jgi:hypothetical protein
MGKRKSWAEKLTSPATPVVKPCPVAIAGMKPGQMMLIPTPQLVDAAIRALQPGVSLTVPAMRQRLAAEHGAEVTCPITTGIFLRIIAEAANEALSSGARLDAVTPVWRVIDAKSPMMKKLSFDTSLLAHQRALEGLPP